MPLELRTVTGQVFDQNGDPLPSRNVVAILKNPAHLTSGETVIPCQTSTSTDTEGNWSVDLWIDGPTGTGYIFYLPTECNSEAIARYDVSIPSGTDPIAFNLLTQSEAIAGESGVIQSITDSLQAHIDTRLDAIALSNSNDAIGTGTASVAISANHVLALVDGDLVPASVDDLNTADKIVGVATNSGTDVTYRISGLMKDSNWNWATGFVYLGLDGALTQTPDFDRDFVFVVGRAVASDTLLVDQDGPYYTQ